MRLDRSIVAVIANMLHAWREPAGWWRKAGSTLLLLACAVAVVAAAAFNALLGLAYNF